MQILKRDNLRQGGFAGLKEHRMVKDPKAFGPQENNDGSWPGLGNFIYLADARFTPYGETHMHSHHEIDVISVMVDGNIAHQGSLQHGQNLSRNEVQIQRAGGEGFSYNEINPDGQWNRMIQLWVLPEVAGQAADYKVYKTATGELTRIYGGETSSCEEGARIQYDDVADYDCINDTAGAIDQFGGSLPGLNDYNITVNVSTTNIGAPAVSARRIDVTITHDLYASINMVLTAYRTSYY